MKAKPGRRRFWLWTLAALAAGLVFAFLLSRTPDVPAEDLRAKYGSPDSQYVELSPGFTVHLRDQGPKDAPALFLVHGSNASLHTWEPWVTRLSSRFRLVSLDLQGHGLTGPILDNCYTTACMASTVEAVRAKLGIERLAIAGNSMGGGVAIAYALSHPERVAGLVLVDSSGAAMAGSGSVPLGFRIARTPVLRDVAASITPRFLVARTLEASVSIKAVASEEAITRYWELLRAPGNREATLDRFGQGFARFDRAALAPLANTPVLILWGEEDALIPVAAARWFKDALPAAQMIIYPGIGHIPHEETPDRSAADVAAFVETAYSAAAL